MKFKLVEIRTIERSLMNLINKEMPIRVAYRLGKLMKIITIELSEIEEHRINLVKKYSKKGKEGDVFEVLPENESDFKREFELLLMEEIDIDFKPIPISDFGDMSISSMDLIKLDKLICDGEEKIKD